MVFLRTIDDVLPRAVIDDACYMRRSKLASHLVSYARTALAGFSVGPRWTYGGDCIHGTMVAWLDRVS